MFIALVLTTLLGVPQGQPAPIPNTVDAVALVREGLHEAALDALRQIAAANPRDHEARVWIGRVHVLMGHPDLAEPVFRSVLLEDPANFDAMFGLGTTLLALGETEDAIEMLERAERAQPRHAEVLSALGRAHAAAGRTSIAVLYAERAVLLSPTPAHRLTFERARLAHGHRIELTSFGERYNSATPDTGSVDLRANFRLGGSLRILGRGQHQRKFNFSEQRGGGGVEWRWRSRTALFGQVLAGSADNVVLPQVDVLGEISHTEGPTRWVAGYRFFDFSSAHVSVVSPGVTWSPSERSWIAVRYDLSHTDFATVSRVQRDHSVGLRAGYRVVPRVWVNGGYARGIEDFDTLSPDRLLTFRANTATGGVRLDLPSLTSVLGTYDHQWRQGSIRMHRLTLSIFQRF